MNAHTVGGCVECCDDCTQRKHAALVRKALRLWGAPAVRGLTGALRSMCFEFTENHTQLQERLILTHVMLMLVTDSVIESLQHVSDTHIRADEVHIPRADVACTLASNPPLRSSQYAVSSPLRTLGKTSRPQYRTCGLSRMQDCATINAKYIMRRPTYLSLRPPMVNDTKKPYVMHGIADLGC